MPVPRHLEEAAARLEAAERTLRAARSEEPPALVRWLEALTDHALALSDIQRFTNESVHEKLHDLVGRVGGVPARAGAPPGARQPAGSETP